MSAKSKELELSVEANMASHSGIRARDPDQGECSRKPILKNAEGYGAWRVKMETILDADDCWDIVQGTEVEPVDLTPAAKVEGEGEAVENPPPTAAEALLIATRRKEVKDYKRRYKKAAFLITQSIDDGIVQTLSVHNKDPKLMWDALSTDYNNVTLAQLSLARQSFLNFRVTEDETYQELKQRINELLRKVVEHNGVVTIEDQL